MTDSEPSSTLADCFVQMELRVLAQLSGDVALRHDFAAGRDVHEATARQLLEKQAEVTEQLSFEVSLWQQLLS